jgi:hypothetical protein
MSARGTASFRWILSWAIIELAVSVPPCYGQLLIQPVIRQWEDVPDQQQEELKRPRPQDAQAQRPQEEQKRPQLQRPQREERHAK